MKGKEEARGETKMKLKAREGSMYLWFTLGTLYSILLNVDEARSWL
jgi:hypothetical protein